MSAHQISVDVLKIAPTPLEAITVHATLVINLQLIIRLVQVSRISLPLGTVRKVLIFTDFNECTLNISGCTQNCTNTIGSYSCSCYSGYQLAADYMTCSGK